MIRRSCLFVRTNSEYSAVLIHPGQRCLGIFRARHQSSPNHDPQHLNPTPWAITFNAAYLTPTNIPDQCAV